MKTFQDFITCSQGLNDSEITDNKNLVISGTAGGLVMGAVINMRPDLYHAVIANVPFVDGINTMIDETMPLVVGEWEEFGDPRKINGYFYMKGYSPYDNISTQQYPNILLEGGLNDSRVKYRDPAKFCAKLREYIKDYMVIYMIRIRKIIQYY